MELERSTGNSSSSLSLLPPPRSPQSAAGGSAARGWKRLRRAGSCLPAFCRGEVVKGFGRGSKELGIPTGERVVENFPSDISTGIEYGWACVGNGDVPKMVWSIGWNPFYMYIKKSETTLSSFKDDFYGEILSIVIRRYIQSEKNFSSLEALISAVQEDTEEAKRQLDLPEHLKLKVNNFFHLLEGKRVNH
ncbi:riboflavin kinase-like [Buteo buteo]|uniref:riboflavin kinase-like n=1 Tax=Buteo buteo TaxID=30397 RepID=UPI003EBAB351